MWGFSIDKEDILSEVTFLIFGCTFVSFLRKRKRECNMIFSHNACSRRGFGFMLAIYGTYMRERGRNVNGNVQTKERTPLQRQLTIWILITLFMQLFYYFLCQLLREGQAGNQKPYIIFLYSKVNPLLPNIKYIKTQTFCFGKWQFI